MILTKENNQIINNELTIKEGHKKDIEYLHMLYTSINFELGYIEHGPIWFHTEYPEKLVITDDYLQVYDEHTWRKNGDRYPVTYHRTKAKNTLILIRQILGYTCNHNFALKNFFNESTKQVISNGAYLHSTFELNLTIKKLEYLLANQELALELLKDGYFDFYLFVNLLQHCNIESKEVPILNRLDYLDYEAKENTPIFDIAKKYVKLK